MSKSDFIERVAKKGKISKTEARRAVELVLGEMESGLKSARKDGKYSIGTFGTFTISARAARSGRNPRTGELIKIKASKTLRFKPSSQLKKAAGAAPGDGREDEEDDWTNDPGPSVSHKKVK